MNYLHLRFEDLASLVDFMYLGEVSVRHEDLPNFMAVAKQLKVNTPCAIG